MLMLIWNNIFRRRAQSALTVSITLLDVPCREAEYPLCKTNNNLPL